MKRKMIMRRLALLALSTFMVTNSIMTVNVKAETIPIDTNQESIEYMDVESVSDLKEDYSQIGGVESFQTYGNIVTIKMVTGEQIRVSLLGDKVFRLYMDPDGKFQENPTPNGKDHITTIREKSDVDYDGVIPKVEDGDIIKIATNAIELRVEKATGKMELINKETNKSIWKEVEPLKYKNNETIQTLETNDEEYFYGGGMQNGRFSHKGKSINIRNENIWTDGAVSSPTPFYFSTNGYGVMRHTFKPGQYDFASTEKGKVITKHSEKRFDAYYFIDEKPNNIINAFYYLTGKPALLPEYAFYLGHANCYSRDWINDETGKESQTPQPGFDRQETLMVDAKDVVDAHINNDMPLGWFLPNDGYGCGYGRADTLDGNIDNLKQFVDYTKSNGIQTGLWTQSQLKPTGNQEAYLERDIDKEVGYAGTNAVKTDVAWVGSGYSFALNSVRQAAEGIEKNSVDRARPFVVTVDGWAGTQRYSSVWSGDQFGGEWEYIRFHIPTYTGAGLSGNPNVGSDMDGIYMGKQPIIQSRDFQWKAFTPIQIDMDGWGSSAKNPYVFDEPYSSINRMYLKLKGEMMPYVYSIANESTNDGMPMIRAMMLEEQNEYTYGTSTEYQYMWGPNLLVAPIYQDTESDDVGNDIRNNIYLPDENQVWIDYFTGEQYRGGVIDNFDAPVWKLPLFVKNGAIIPMSNENNTPEYIKKEQRIYEVYPSGETSFDVYEDDGLTTDYKEGKSATTKITSSAPKEGRGKAIIKAGLLGGDYEGIVTERTTDFVVNVSEKPEDLSLKVGESKVDLKEASSLEEFNNGTNLYFYDETPNLNKYATKGSEFEKVEITTTPKLYVKAEKVNVKENEIELTINDFINDNGINNNELNKKLSIPEKINIIEDSITGSTIDLTWEEVKGATSYEVEINGIIFRDIKGNKYQSRELTPETVQNYRVRSVNKDGYSEWSDIITSKTGFDKYKNVPENMKVLWTAGHWASQKADYIVDGNDATFFYTQAKATENPIIIDMNEEYDIDKLDILGMTTANGSTGGLKRVEIQTSADGANYETVFSNSVESGNSAWEADDKLKTINFEKPVKARYVKLVIKESVSNRILLKEVRPYKVDKSIGEVDKTELIKLVSSAEILVEDNYTPESFILVKESLSKAKEVLVKEDATEIEVNEAITDLQDAISNLVDAKIVVSKVNKLKSQNVAKTSTELVWEEPDNTVGLVGYVIYKDGKVLTEIKKEATNYKVEGLKANTIYGFKVIAKYSNGAESKPKSVNVRTSK